jgi:hypothetical protein
VSPSAKNPQKETFVTGVKIAILRYCSAIEVALWMRSDIDKDGSLVAATMLER